MIIKLKDEVDLSEYFRKSLGRPVPSKLLIRSFGPVSCAADDSLCFSLNEEYPSRFSVLLIPHDSSLEICDDRVVRVDDPRREFARIVSYLKVQDKIINHFITPYRGRGVNIHPTAAIYEPVHIGENVQIHENAVIHSNSHIGNDVIIRAGAIVGAEGFGFARDENNKPFPFPHFGAVRLGDRVEVGNYSIISRGAFSDTQIGPDTKINSFVFVGHNVIVGSRVYLMVRSTLTGGSIVDDDAVIGPASLLIKKSRIGVGAKVGAMSMVNRAIDAFDVCVGVPAVSLRNTK